MRAIKALDRLVLDYPNHPEVGEWMLARALATARIGTRASRQEAGLALRQVTIDRAGEPEAAAACNAGIEGYNAWRADAIGHLDQAIKADPDFALPRMVKAWILHMARSAAYAPKIAELTQQAEAGLDRGLARPRAALGSAWVLNLSGLKSTASCQMWILGHKIEHVLLQIRSKKFKEGNGTTTDTKKTNETSRTQQS